MSRIERNEGGHNVLPSCARRGKILSNVVPAHRKCHQQKMKVKLAVQALNSSVADAIEYCNQVLKLLQFQGSEATVEFIRLFDRLFNILNSRSFFSKGYKASLRLNNKCQWEPFLTKASKYISTLKDGKLLCKSKRKTAIIGFLVCIESAKNVFFDLVEHSKTLRFLLIQIQPRTLRLF